MPIDYQGILEKLALFPLAKLLFTFSFRSIDLMFFFQDFRLNTEDGLEILTRQKNKKK